jgi:hypothetical protein
MNDEDVAYASQDQEKEDYDQGSCAVAHCGRRPA